MTVSFMLRLQDDLPGPRHACPLRASHSAAAGLLRLPSGLAWPTALQSHQQPLV